MAKKKKKTGWIILLCLLIIIVSGAFWQRNNIMAVLLFTRYSKTELEAKLSEEKSESEGAMNKLSESIPDLTEAEKQKLNKGEITKEEAVKLILERSENGSVQNLTTGPSNIKPNSSPSQNNSSGSVTGNSSDQTKPSSSPTDTVSTPKNADEQRIKELLAQLYVFRTTYTDSLDKLMQQAKSEFLALPKSEQNNTGKKKILLEYIGQATSLENSCDSKVNIILIELKSLLIKTGGDLSLIDDIKNAYNQEKSLKKAYYINQLNK